MKIPFLKPTSIFNKIKVQKQLYIIFFLAIFIPTVTIGNYLVYHIRSLLIDHYQEQVYSDNLRVKSLMLDLLANVQSKANSLASDKELRQILCQKYQSDNEAEKAVDSFNGFRTTLSQDIPIQRISVYTWNNSIPESKYIHQIKHATEEQAWFKRIVKNVTPFWSVETSTDDFGNSVSYLCYHTRIFLPQINRFAILNITVNNNHMKNRIQNGSLDSVLWLNNGNIFYNSDAYLATDQLFDIAKKAGNSYTGKMNIGGKQAIGCVSALYISSSLDDYFYIASINDGAYDYINKVTIAYLAILILVLFVAGGFIYLYSRYFSKRVITLRETMHNVSLGNYQITDDFQGKDEISSAFEDLNVMVQNIIKNETSVYEAQIREQDLKNKQQQMEFKMLSSQINPHFLYNTLETIRMRALKAGNREVANAVKLLGKSMRYVLENTTTSFTSLSKELDYIETYLSIQKLRFHDRVNYTLKVPPDMDLSEYQIMPLLLQPIVENALLHGLEETEQNGHIIIHIKKDDETLYIQIFDNGCGMTEKEMQQIQKNIYDRPPESSKSIGLYNICQRIELCFGKQYGLDIKSKKDFGTMITVTIPAQKYRRETES